jgi:hypothetical protein
VSLSLSEYQTKYPVFAQISQLAYDSAIADAAIELALHSWGDLYPRAEQMLIGHILYQQDPNAYSSLTNYSSVKVDTQGYQTQSVATDSFGANLFGKEYKRLLGLISQDRGNVRSPSFGVSCIVQRPAPVEVKW